MDHSSRRLNAPAIASDLDLTSSPRLFVARPLAPGLRFDLPPATAHHLARVLRLGTGATVTLFNGDGGEYRAIVGTANKTGVDVKVGDRLPVDREAAIHLRLVQCLMASDKMDDTVRKAVELGVTEIVPVISRRSVVRLAGERAERRADHWRQIVVAASEQCGRNRLAGVAEIRPIEDWLARTRLTNGRRLVLSPHAATTLPQALSGPAVTDIELLIGPEGGLTGEETALATNLGFSAVRLGPRVLRTETAGLAAIAAAHALCGDFI